MCLCNSELGGPLVVLLIAPGNEAPGRRLTCSSGPRLKEGRIARAWTKSCGDPRRRVRRLAAARMLGGMEGKVILFYRVDHDLFQPLL